MTLGAHFLGGAVVCRHMKQPVVGLVLAFLSHLLLDAVPHFEGAGVRGALFSESQVPWVVAVFKLSPVVAGALAVVVWFRYAVREPRSKRQAAYLIAGGFLGTLMDILTTVFSHHNFIGRVNRAAHWWIDWANTGTPQGSPEQVWLAAGMLAVEGLLMVALAWVLFRRSAQKPAAD